MPSTRGAGAALNSGNRRTIGITLPKTVRNSERGGPGCLLTTHPSLLPSRIWAVRPTALPCTEGHTSATPPQENMPHRRFAFNAAVRVNQDGGCQQNKQSDCLNDGGNEGLL